MRENSVRTSVAVVRLAVDTVRRAIPVFVICMLALTSGPAFAQETTGSIVGSVEDPSGAAIAGAIIELIDGDLHLTAMSDEEGGYQFLDVPPGTYKFTATASGFKTVTRTDVSADHGRIYRVDVYAEVGLEGETVEVSEDDEPIIDITPTKTASSVSYTEFEDIPEIP